MKKRFIQILVCVLCICALFSISSSAHSGKTDASGGHIDHSTGEYHYHHGYPAHQHTDGVCPYDFDDKTSHNSGSSGSSHSTNSNHSSHSYEDDGKDKITAEEVVSCAAVLVPFALIIYYFGGKEERKRKKVEKAEFTSKYADKTKNQIANLCGMPLNIEIGSDGNPKYKLSQVSNDFSFYVTRTGHSYHKTNGCSGAYIHVNIDGLKDLKPCRRCKPENFEWYFKYQYIMGKIKQHKIHITPDDRLPPPS